MEKCMRCGEITDNLFTKHHCPVLDDPDKPVYDGPFEVVISLLEEIRDLLIDIRENQQN